MRAFGPRSRNRIRRKLTAEHRQRHRAFQLEKLEDRRLLAMEGSVSIFGGVANLDLPGPADEGREFVDELAMMTGAAVFANDAPVGSGDLGDFVWEYHTGPTQSSAELLSISKLESVAGFVLPDTQDPVVSAAQASPNPVVRGNDLTITWTATDNVGVKHMGLYLYQGTAAVDTRPYVTGGTADGQLRADPAFSNTGQYVWSVPGTLPAGSYRIKVVAWDTSLRTGYRFSNDFSVQLPDTQDPVVSAAQASPNPVVRGNDLTITWTATDNVGVKHMGLYLYQGTAAVDTRPYVTGGTADGQLRADPAFPNNGQYVWFVPSNLPIGNYRIKVVAWDTSGNSSSGILPNGQLRYKWVDVTVTSPELQPPVVTSANVSPPSVRAGNVLSIAWTSTGTVDHAGLYLLKGGVQVRTIHLKPPLRSDGGCFDWTVPTDLTPGDDYRLKVVVWADPFNENPRAFLVSDPFSIAVVTPQVTSVSITPDPVKTGALSNVHWATTGTVDHVRLYLERPGFPTVTLGTAATQGVDGGVFAWRVPTDLQPGSGYRIKVVARAHPVNESPQATATTANFSVEAGTVQPGIADAFDFPVGFPDGKGYGATGWKFLQHNSKVFHPGEDWNGLGGGDSDKSNPVHAIANGVVVAAANFGSGWGNIVLLRHELPDGRLVWSQYAHLEEITVKKGETVDRGNQVGTIGKGYDNEHVAHLHFEIRKADLPANAWPRPDETAEQIAARYYHPTEFIQTHRQLIAPDTEKPVVQSAWVDRDTVPQGERVKISWIATDNRGIDHVSLHLYDSSGQMVDTSVYEIGDGDRDGRLDRGAENIKTKGNGAFSWAVYPSLPPDLYRVKVVAWDKAGNPSNENLNGTPRFKWVDVNVTLGQSGEGVDDAFLERLARDFVYQAHALHDTTERGYEVAKVISRTISGFYALALESLHNPPILVFRGTQPTQINDVLADFDHRGVGYRQYESAAGEVLAWLGEAGADVILVGHSLGGALAQTVAAVWTSLGGHLGQVVTFNSPGIRRNLADGFRPAAVGTVMHYVTSGDLVSMAGDAFVEGSWRLSEFSDLNLVNKHVLPVLNTSIGDRARPHDLTWKNHAEVAWLNSPWFCFADPDYFLWLAAGQIATLTPPLRAYQDIPRALVFRGTTENARQQIGQFFDEIAAGVNLAINPTSVSVRLPDFRIGVAGLLRIDVDDMELTYREVPESFRIQGKVTLPDLYEASANFAGDNYIEIDERGLHVVGELSVEDVPIVPGVWSLAEAHIGYDSDARKLVGGASVEIPTGIEVGGQLEFVGRELNAATVFADNINKPAGTTGFFLKRVEGSVNHLAPSDKTPISFTGGVTVTGGPSLDISDWPNWLLPEFLDDKDTVELLSMDLSATIDRNHLEGSGSLELLEGLITTAEQTTATAAWNWDEGYLEATGQLSILGDAVTASGRLRADADLNFTLYATGTVTFPEDMRIIGGYGRKRPS